MTRIDTPAEQTPPLEADADEIVAEPEVGYRWKHLMMALLMIAGGLWFAYDGWINWPRMNEMAVKIEKQLEAAQHAKPIDDNKVTELSKEKDKYIKHTSTDILFQKILATVLPAIGLFWLVWTIKDTRGRYRLSGDTLYVPGHPPVSFSAIRRIDKRKWDRKGIAYLHYEHGVPATPAVLKLDDFAYERRPTDEILKRIEKNVLTSAPSTMPRR
jgi:hypothetical protein